MKRAKHNLSHYKLTTCNIGQLVPITCMPVLPGDTVQHATSAMIRLSPLNTPVMHPTQVRIHHMFVPNRLTWPESESGGWEQFITGGPDGLNSAQIPTVSAEAAPKGGLIDHLYGCLPTGVLNVNALAIRAFNMCFNEYYRDQDLVLERDLEDLTIPRIAWEKDYFGVARPFTQKGPDVTLPIGAAELPVSGIGHRPAAAYGAAEATISESGPTDTNYASAMHVSNALPSGFFLEEDPDNPGYPNVFADATSLSAPSVNEFRAAFSLQRYQEARARYGSRFTEYLRYLGVRPSDARLQRPEYLGGGTARVNFSEVLQTGVDPEPPGQGQRAYLGVGDMYGHGIAGARTNRYRKFFEEHGYVISFLSVRPKAMYVNGLPREHMKRTKEDFFQKELANLGQQEVFSNELFAAGATPNDIFGYTDRYQEYRHHPNQISGDFRDTLNPYHMGRDLAQGPVLNESFITCDPTDRIFQVGEDTADTLWCFINHRVVARRIVPKRANPRIL